MSSASPTSGAASAAARTGAHLDDASRPAHSLQRTMEELLSTASRAVDDSLASPAALSIQLESPVAADASAQPQSSELIPSAVASAVHALNVLRCLFRDTNMGLRTLPFASAALQVCCMISG